MEIIDNKAVKFLVRNPDRITSVIPKSKYIGEVEPGVHEIVVHFGLEEAQVLKNLKIKGVRSPIAFTYDWPGIYKPFAHQKTTAEFLTLNRKAFCFNEQGTGKTASVIWAADYLMSIKHVRRCLILCPLSIMQSAWLADLSNSIIHRSAIVAHHSQASRRIEMIQQDYEFVITNYEGLNLIADEINADGRFDLVIVDEANAYKTVTTRRWKALKSIIKPNTHVWMMTGTPASQSPVDAYGLAKLVNPDGVPNFFTAWRDKVMNKITLYKWAAKHNAAEVVHEALQPAIRFSKAQCLDLPPVLTTTREVPLTPQQAKYYNMLKDRMLVQAAGETISAVNAATQINKLLQIACGSVYTDTGEVVDFDVSNRLNVVQEVIEESSNKVLVFVPFTHTIDLLRKHLEKNGITCDVINGAVSANARADIVQTFQNSENPKVLIIQPQAASHGLTLTAADTIIWYAPCTSVETYLQANARIDRPGQVNPMTVIHIKGSQIEQRMYQLLRSNIRNHNEIVDLYRQEILAMQEEIT